MDIGRCRGLRRSSETMGQYSHLTIVPADIKKRSAGKLERYLWYGQHTQAALCCEIILPINKRQYKTGLLDVKITPGPQMRSKAPRKMRPEAS